MPGRRTRQLLNPNAWSPGARSAAIIAASAAMVPLPHIGSSSGNEGLQRVSASRPAPGVAQRRFSARVDSRASEQRLARRVDDRRVAVRRYAHPPSGWRLSIDGRTPVSARIRSHTASFTRNVANSRLVSGDRVASISTRSVRVGRKWRVHSIALTSS
jgi:hypothetical protein